MKTSPFVCVCVCVCVLGKGGIGRQRGGREIRNILWQHFHKTRNPQSSYLIKSESHLVNFIIDFGSLAWAAGLEVSVTWGPVWISLFFFLKFFMIRSTVV